MKTENLDKLLDELARLVSPFSDDIPKGIILAQESNLAVDKLAAFMWVREVLEPAHKWGHVRGQAKHAADFCSHVAMYYMLKGAGAESEIVNHRELDVIMGVLK